MGKVIFAKFRSSFCGIGLAKFGNKELSEIGENGAINGVQQ